MLVGNAAEHEDEQILPRQTKRTEIVDGDEPPVAKDGAICSVDAWEV